MEQTTTAITTPLHEEVPLKEKLSYAFTNTGQTLIYGLFNMLLFFMTDYLYIVPSIAGIIIGVARIYDALIDPFIGIIVDKTKSKWGKCRPYMLLTPIPVALVGMALFAPTGLTGWKVVVYATVLYFLFTTVYSLNDIPYWSMSAVITSNPKQRVSIVTLTRIIGGAGSAITIGIFWTVNKLFAGTGADKNMSFFLSVCCFCVVGAAVMLQGFFNTKERAVPAKGKSESLKESVKYILKCKPLMLNFIGGALYSVVVIGMSALTTYFVKWNIKELFPTMNSDTVMSIFTPVIGILPAIATLAGIIAVPFLIKKFEKKTLLILFCSFGVAANLISYFVGYGNLIVFMVLRFLSFLPVGIWSGITTLMIGDAVDYIEYHQGVRLEGTCFSILTFMGNFQNSVSIALVGIILKYVQYNGALNADTQQQLPITLKGIFIMVTLVSAAGYLIGMIPFLFYKLDNKTHKFMVEENARRKAEAEALETEEAAQ